MKYFVLISLLFSSLAFAKDYKLSKNEFLKKLDEGRVSLDKTPLNNIPEQIFPQLIQKMKQQYPDFQREMWYVAYIDSNNYRYFVFYEWYNRGCIFGIQETKKYGKNKSSTTVVKGGRKIGPRIGMKFTVTEPVEPLRFRTCIHSRFAWLGFIV